MVKQKLNMIKKKMHNLPGFLYAKSNPNFLLLTDNSVVPTKYLLNLENSAQCIRLFFKHNTSIQIKQSYYYMHNILNGVFGILAAHFHSTGLMSKSPDVR